MKSKIKIFSKNKFAVLALGVLSAVASVSCNDDDDNSNMKFPDFSGTYMQQDQMARPAINTVFIASGQPKDDFNETIPSMMGATYQSVFESKLMALNSAYTTNALGMDAATFTGALATDVLNVKTSGTTTFLTELMF